MAEEKVSHDISPDEKVAEDAQKQEHQFAEQTERRKSVALNIVENPLRVSFAINRDTHGQALSRRASPASRLDIPAWPNSGSNTNF